MFETLRTVGAGAAGWWLRFATAPASARASAVNDCLQRIDDLAEEAEQSARLISKGKGDPALSVRVATLREVLGTTLRRSLHGSRSYPRVTVALGLFGASLIAADCDALMPPDEAAFQNIRDQQQALRTVVQNIAKESLWWKLFRHPRPS